MDIEYPVPPEAEDSQTAERHYYSVLGGPVILDQARNGGLVQGFKLRVAGDDVRWVPIRACFLEETLSEGEEFSADSFGQLINDYIG